MSPADRTFDRPVHGTDTPGMILYAIEVAQLS